MKVSFSAIVTLITRFDGYLGYTVSVAGAGTTITQGLGHLARQSGQCLDYLRSTSAPLPDYKRILLCQERGSGETSNLIIGGRDTYCYAIAQYTENNLNCFESLGIGIMSPDCP